MAKFKLNFPQDDNPIPNDSEAGSSGAGRGSGPPRGGPPPLPSRRPMGFAPAIVGFLLIAAIVYGGYYWFVRRIVVGPDEVLILLKKNGTKSLPDGQIIIPRRPEKPKEPPANATDEQKAKYEADLAAWPGLVEQWEKDYGDCNGIHEEVYPPGTYFEFSPFDYERTVIDIRKTADVPQGKVGIVVKRFGQPLDPGQVLADPSRDQRGPLPQALEPGRHYPFANPFAYTIMQVDTVSVDPGHRGVVTMMAARLAQNPNQYLVENGEQGVQKQTEPEGFLRVNPFQKRITPISIRSQRFDMTGKETIVFPSADSFDIQLEGFVEWSIDPTRLSETYAKFSEGGELLPLVEKTIILPYARSYSRLVGSQYKARDFISGDTKIKFQEEFEAMLRKSCKDHGVEILQALVRDIIPPVAIKQPINEREIAKEQILQYEQQILVAESQAKLATQEEMANQNKAIGEANKEVVTVIKQAERDRDVAITRAQQDLAVAKLRLEAAQKQADAQVARGQAEANVILLNLTAQAEPLRQQVLAFGGGEAYARYFFYQKIAPAMKSILSNTDGPFADIFRQFATPPAGNSVASERQASDSVTGVQP